MSTNCFSSYLRSKIAGKGVPFTHTRIGDKDKIYGGTYQIDDQRQFIDRYYKHVFDGNNLEYLTEKQLVEDGPLLIDIDLSYDPSVNSKQHSTNHVLDLIMLYLEKCRGIFKIPNDTIINAYAMEKTNVNCLEKKTKDGIHIIIGIKMHKAVQVMLRRMILEEIKVLWEDLPIKNTWEDVLDEGVTKGHVNWQLYGSRKPKHDAYLIKKHYCLSLNDDEWELDDQTEKLNIKKEIHNLSARCNTHPEFEYLPDMKETVSNEVKLLSQKTVTKIRIKQRNKNSKQYEDICSMTTLDSMLEDLFDNLSTTEYKVRETHEYTMTLPNSYYGPGSFAKWIRVGWALANTDRRLFLSWLKMSSQDNCRDTLSDTNGKFDWNNVPELYETWKTFDSDNPDSLSHRSILYWSKNDAPREEYEKVKRQTVDYFIQQTLETKVATEYDIANVLHTLYKEQFACVSIKNNRWYEYKNNRWRENDSGNSLRLHISKEMHHEYLERIIESTLKLQGMDQLEPAYESTRVRTQKMTEIATHLKTTTWKNNIMREVRDLFFDPDFMKKLDQNPYLLCFNNGVVDFKNKCIRRGQPDDYISKCTNIDYITLTPKHGEAIKEINTFVNELFPDEELRRYMWDHLASILVGTNENQTFNIYTGSGRNGKSKLVELMSKGLGDYKGTVPITLITQNRNSIGSTSSEIVQLMGTRYAVMQEPSKGDKINEGIMKEITGGDPIQGRALFQEPITFIPQFKLVVCTNTLFDIKSNDDGTWRRIRVCDFKSKFVENPYENESKFPKAEYPYQYLIDKNIDKKFEIWAPVMMAMLVEMAYAKQGNVQDCDMVLASSDVYREGQDYLTEFCKEKVQKKRDGKIKKTELLETFRNWYQVNYGRQNIPKGREVYEYMDHKYGKYRQGWHNISIIYDEEENDDEMLENV